MARRGQDEERHEAQKNLALAGPPPAQLAARLATAERRIAQLELQVKDLADRVDAARRIAVDARDAADPRHWGGDGR